MSALSEQTAVSDFLEIDDLTRDGLGAVLSLAAKVKDDPEVLENALSGMSIGILFEKPSTRTRVSLDAGIAQLGAHPIVLLESELQLGRGETVGDTGRVLDRYLDALAGRVKSHDTLIELADAMDAPVINALSDLAHPLQALADLQTLTERGANSVAYVGDGNNVARSLVLGCAMVGLDIRIASPAGFQLDNSVIGRANEYAAASGGSVSVGEDTLAAVEGADALYTDVWVSMGDESTAERRRSALSPYRIDRNLLAHASDGAIVLHCLPAHRGDEISADVLDGPQSAVFDQAENRLHAQKALLAMLLKGEL